MKNKQTSHPAHPGKPKLNFGVLKRLLGMLYRYYPVMVPLTVLCAVFNAVASAIPSIFMQQVIELIRQFYDGVRCVRIVGEQGERRYLRYTNSGLQDKPSGQGYDGQMLFRRPVFDIEVRAEREAPLDRAGRNRLLLELYRAGLFDPKNRDAAERALAGMDFEGIDSLRARLRNGGGAFSEVRP